jgi:hypothetical protein
MDNVTVKNVDDTLLAKNQDQSHQQITVSYWVIGQNKKQAKNFLHVVNKNACGNSLCLRLILIELKNLQVL